MRLHLVALPHTRVEPGFCGCAYTMKVLKMCKMLGERHEIFLYAPEGAPVPGVTLVQCLSENRRIAIFGKDDLNRLPDFPTDAQSRLFNIVVVGKILERAQPRDLVLLTGGLLHKPIHDLLPDMICCEPTCGYEGIFTDKVAFESYAWMHSMYMKWGINNIRWFDCVIPPYCDPDEFPHLNDGNGKYLLFLGRLISRKGPQIALEIAKAAGLPLYVAGAGGTFKEGGTGYALTEKGPPCVKVPIEDELVGLDVTLKGAHSTIVHVGPVDIEQRAKLMAGARALIVPTTYCEPGGNVAIEAMLAGTPVIAPDWGVYSETVQHGVSGFHFRMFREAVEAVQKAGELKPALIRQYAVERYSLAAVAPLYDRWFARLQTLFGDGWYAE